MSEKMGGRFTGYASTFNMYRRYGGRFCGLTITKKDELWELLKELL